ncbi:uncharacterized protein LOC110658188 [Hevea brasiliensis]|uniref:uncharacterized protein LOC110658188 n=1 Tax=Hevea brasiliensis TaxID=3981 RepID=UPI0025EF6082|nr:uncharacterized protein LOC110658188 [Hevea brasiliensis]
MNLHSRRESEDLCAGKTFGSSEHQIMERRDVEKRERQILHLMHCYVANSFELVRKEHKAIDEKQKNVSDEHKENLDPDIAKYSEDSRNHKRISNFLLFFCACFCMQRNIVHCLCKQIPGEVFSNKILKPFHMQDVYHYCWWNYRFKVTPHIFSLGSIVMSNWTRMRAPCYPLPTLLISLFKKVICLMVGASFSE